MQALALGAEVAGGVQLDQGADPGDQQDEQEAEAVEAQVDGQPQRRHPFEASGRDVAVEDAARLRQRPGEGDGRQRCGDQEGAPAEPTAGGEQQQAGRDRGEEQHGQHERSATP